MGVVEHSRLSYVIRKNLEPESETQHLSFCPHILLADNDTMTRRLVAWGLRKSGYEVTESTCSALLCELVDLKSGRDFLSLFDLVITDIYVHGFEGVEIFSRAQSGTTQPVLVFSSLDRGCQTISRIRNLTLIQKPLVLDSLLSQVFLAVTSNHKLTLSSLSHL